MALHRIGYVISGMALVTGVWATATAGAPGAGRGYSVVQEQAPSLPEPRRILNPDGEDRPGVPTQKSVEAARPFPGSFPVAPTAQWTYMVYMDGDNDLEDYVVSDIETELAVPGSGPDVHVVTIADRIPGFNTEAGNWTGTLLFHVEPGQSAASSEAIADLGERNMGDPNTLSEFVSWSKAHYPAEKYALVFWDHGWAWRPGQSVIDDTNGDSLELGEVSDALEMAGPVDVVGFDECFMATVEVHAALRPHARALVGSEDYVGWEGFKHDEVLTALSDTPEMDAQDLAVVLGRSMTDRTVSAVALDERWDRMMGALEDWTSALKASQAVHGDQLVTAWRNSQLFGDPVQKDLFDLARQTSLEVDDVDVRRSSDALQSAISEVVLYEWHRSFYKSAHGITIYWPLNARDLWVRYTPGIDDFQFYCDELEFSRQSSWDEFLMEWTSGR